MKKPKHIQIADELLMAPFDAMDRHGNDAARHEAPLSSLKGVLARTFNEISQPYFKLCTVFAGAAYAADPASGGIGNGVLLAALTINYAGIRKMSKVMVNDIAKHFGVSDKNYYLIPRPPSASESLNPHIEMELHREKKRSLNQAKNTMLLAGAIGTGLGVVGLGFDSALMFASYMMASNGFDEYSRFYRADRVLKGHWTATTEKPKKQKKESRILNLLGARGFSHA